MTGESRLGRPNEPSGGAGGAQEHDSCVSIDTSPTNPDWIAVAEQNVVGGSFKVELLASDGGFTLLATGEDGDSMKRASVYARRGVMLVCPSSRTTDGVWVVTKPVAVVPGDASDADLGATVKASLDQSAENVPHPDEWDAVLQPLLAAAGVKSWKAFVTGTECIELELSSVELRLIRRRTWVRPRDSNRTKADKPAIQRRPGARRSVRRFGRPWGFPPRAPIRLIP
jgi:hypothetical protein